MQACHGRPPLARTVAAALSLLAVAASAATISVPTEAPTIAAGLARAARGDIVLVACGVYREHDLRLPPGVSLWSGSLDPGCAVIDAGGAGRVLLCEDADSSTTVVGFTLTGGRTDGAGGGILCQDAEPRLTRCLITGNAAASGGGLAASGGRGPVLEHCQFRDNDADLAGGAIAWSAAGQGRLRTCDLRDNEAGGGGGAIAASGGELLVATCVMAGNAGGVAGAAVTARDATVHLVACTLADNRTEPEGGVVHVDGATIRLDRCVIAFHGAPAVAGPGPAWPLLTACNLHGNAGGDWTGALAPQAGQTGNLSVDPLFCDRARGDYQLRRGSPCLPGGAAGIVRTVGALGRGCGS